jgi:hypothetical protein
MKRGLAGLTRLELSELLQKVIEQCGLRDEKPSSRGQEEVQSSLKRAVREFRPNFLQTHVVYAAVDPSPESV